MHFSSSYLALPLVTIPAMAVNLFVSSYSGTITTLELNSNEQGAYTLEKIFSNEGSSPSPSNLHKDPKTGILYCVDEGNTTPEGSLTTYSIAPDGGLAQISRQKVLTGPVSSMVYNDGTAVAVASFGGSAITTFTVGSSGELTPLESFNLTMPAPGVDPARQPAPRPHQAILDPSGKFLLFPDLGADLVRIYSIEASTGRLQEKTPLKVKPGSGPRHGVFAGAKGETAGQALTDAQGGVKRRCKLLFYLVSEISSMITGFEVKYEQGTMAFTQVFESGITGPEVGVPYGSAAAEIVLSPDRKYILTSNRNATQFEVPNFDPNNSTAIPSDTLQSWTVCPATGHLKFKQNAPAGGAFPRQFSLNKDGSLVAVGLQNDERVAIVQRNVENGELGAFVATIQGLGLVTSVIWDD